NSSMLNSAAVSPMYGRKRVFAATPPPTPTRSTPDRIRAWRVLATRTPMADSRKLAPEPHTRRSAWLKPGDSAATTVLIGSGCVLGHWSIHKGGRDGHAKSRPNRPGPDRQGLPAGADCRPVRDGARRYDAPHRAAPGRALWCAGDPPDLQGFVRQGESHI